jgi:hypothetical protein
MRVRRIFFLEAVLAGAFAGIFVATCVSPDWIERISGAAPDNGSGESEWGIAAILGLASLLCALLAGFESRRAGRPASEVGNV